MRREHHRTRAVVKREFNASVRTKTFIFGTLFGPVLIIALFALPILLAGESGGVTEVAVVDATGRDVGEAIAEALPDPVPAAERAPNQWYFRTEVMLLDGSDAEAVRAAIEQRIELGELDGYLWLPAGLGAGEAVVYEGRNATSLGVTALLESAVETTVHERRLRTAGIDPARVTAALRPVAFQARKTGDAAATGGAQSTFFLAYLLGFAIYMVVILYGQATMRGVLEEKRDRIAEITMSSIRAPQLMLGKVLGIGGAGLLQVLIWIGFAALVLTQGEAIAARFGQQIPELPQVPLRVTVTFLLFFMGGFFLYSVLYAAVGAIVTSEQEAQQLVFPVLAPLIAAIVLMAPVLTNPTGTIAVVGSLVPFTSPVLMPMRATLTAVPPGQVIGGLALLIATTGALVWVAAKIYRVGMLATGKKPSMGELWRWVRTA